MLWVFFIDTWRTRVWVLDQVCVTSGPTVVLKRRRRCCTPPPTIQLFYILNNDVNHIFEPLRNSSLITQVYYGRALNRATIVERKIRRKSKKNEKRSLKLLNESLVLFRACFFLMFYVHLLYIGPSVSPHHHYRQPLYITHFRSIFKFSNLVCLLTTTLIYHSLFYSNHNGRVERRILLP